MCYIRDWSDHVMQCEEDNWKAWVKDNWKAWVKTVECSCESTRKSLATFRRARVRKSTYTCTHTCMHTYSCHTILHLRMLRSGLYGALCIGSHEVISLARQQNRFLNAVWISRAAGSARRGRNVYNTRFNTLRRQLALGSNEEFDPWLLKVTIIKLVVS